MGGVTLLVADLDAMTTYYRDAITLDVLSTGKDRVVLGRKKTPVVTLVHSPRLKHASPRSAGLYHTAVLFDSREALASTLYRAARLYPGSFTGSADHLVSQAFYFDDPEGNGVELYWDRDRADWDWIHGQVKMDTLALDPNAFLQEHLHEAIAGDPHPGWAQVGHVHLRVGDIASARDFYVNRLGFDVSAEMGDHALFVSAGGYHHHMAMNTWQSRGAGVRNPALGLGRVDIVVPTSDDLDEIAERMAHFGIATQSDGRTLSFEDPWANAIRVTSQ